METEDAGARQCKNLYQEWIYIETIDGDSMVEVGNITSEKDRPSDVTAQMQEGFKLSRKQLMRQRYRLNQKTRKTTGDK